MTSAADRFSTRVENYAKYRPGYPPQVLDLLREHCGLSPQAIVADVGSGTGILSELFLRNGNRVYAVEPNLLMRQAAQKLSETYPQFVAVAGAAEVTTLPSASVDFVTAGQAFHWFDAAKARAEFVRILQPQGWVILIWNERRLDSTPFLRAYERLLLRYGTDYELVRHDQAQKSIEEFFRPANCTLVSIDNVQHLSLEAFRGRVFSASYTPEPGHPDFDSMVNALHELFDSYSHSGTIDFEYDTRVYFGKLLTV